MTPTTHISENFLDLLSTDEQDDWQSMECWTYANDGERASNEWGDGPAISDFSLLDWVSLAEKSPRLVEICGMQGAIDRWRCNHPDPEQRRKWFEQHEPSSVEPIGEPPF